MTDGPTRRVADRGIAALMTRLEALERRNITADADHIALRMADSQTAGSVDKLAAAINDPRTGLIVELERFREEVRNDRRVFKAWIAGAAAAISGIFSLVTVYAPSIRDILGIAQK